MRERYTSGPKTTWGWHPMRTNPTGVEILMRTRSENDRREIWDRLKYLAERIDALEGPPGWPALTVEPEVDPRAGECHRSVREDGHHVWSVITEVAGIPTGRKCHFCEDEQRGTMMWDEARAEELD